MKTANRHFRSGVSLLETVLAASLLGGAVMTVCGLSAGSLRAVRLNQESEKAWDYVERQFTLIDMAGVEAFRLSGQSGGQFESLDGRLWRWTVMISDTGITSLYDVAIRIDWDSGGKRRQIECRTRMTARAAVVDEAQSTESTDAQTTTTPTSTTPQSTTAPTTTTTTTTRGATR
jgi:hypothetical protein